MTHKQIERKNKQTRNNNYAPLLLVECFKLAIFGTLNIFGSGRGPADRAHFCRYEFSDFTMMIYSENHVGNQICSSLALKMKQGDFLYIRA